jgi:hypothetical protein
VQTIQTIKRVEIACISTRSAAMPPTMADGQLGVNAFSLTFPSSHPHFDRLKPLIVKKAGQPGHGYVTEAHSGRCLCINL